MMRGGGCQKVWEIMQEGTRPHTLNLTHTDWCSWCQECGTQVVSKHLGSLWLTRRACACVWCILLTYVLYGRMPPKGLVHRWDWGPWKQSISCPQADTHDYMNTHANTGTCTVGAATLTYRDRDPGRHFSSGQVEMSPGVCWKVPPIYLVSLLSTYCVSSLGLETEQDRRAPWIPL